jgi:hypothetical protein
VHVDDPERPPHALEDVTKGRKTLTTCSVAAMYLRTEQDNLML